MIRWALYRAEQFFLALTAPLARTELGEAENLLSPPQRALFERMAAPDRRHALAVYRALRQQEVKDEAVLVAALLHDVGKAKCPPPLWVRVAVVLMERFAPRLLERIAEGDSRGWRRPFAVCRRHTEIGAEWAAQAGCSPLVVDLIRRHHTPISRPEDEPDALLALLQAADTSRTRNTQYAPGNKKGGSR